MTSARPHPLDSILRTGLLTAVCWLASCKTPPPPPPPDTAQKPAGLYEWNGEGRAITHITINVDHQKAYLFSGKDEVGWTYVATGITSFPTPTGEFAILEKVSDKVSNLYGKGYDKDGKLVNSDFKIGRDLLPEGGRFEPAKMPYFMRLTGDGVGMHIGPIPKPGRRASHGCIRMPRKSAAIVYQNAPIGTPVSIVGTGPDYKTYMSQAAAKAKSNAAKLAASKQKAAEDAAAKAQADASAALTPAAPLPVNSPPVGATPPVQPAGSAGSLPAPKPAPTPGAMPALTEEVKRAEPAAQNPGS